MIYLQNGHDVAIISGDLNKGEVDYTDLQTGERLWGCISRLKADGGFNEIENAIKSKTGIESS